MAKAIFTSKVKPTYDDLPEERYHFPRTYLRQVERAVGDLVVYYEPRRQDANLSGREGRQAYVAVARVRSVDSDPNKPDHFYARMSDYVPFVQAVPFRLDDTYFESGLRKADGSTNKGQFGRAVRDVPDAEFEAIVAFGMGSLLTESLVPPAVPGLAEPPASFQHPVVQVLMNRKLRDAAFARSISDAYDKRCAVTGLRIINGGGRAEIEAAHIRPVERDGPDSPRNGLALCRTAHWMFDRGLIGLRTDGRFDVNTSKVPEDARRLLRPDGKLILPQDVSLQPHRIFVDWHRTNIYEPKLQSLC